MKYAITAPAPNSVTDVPTKETAYRRSFACRPGVMNRQSCHSQIGDDTMIPAYSDSLRVTVNASRTPVTTSAQCALSNRYDAGRWQ